MKMAFVYSGVQYDQKELLRAISNELPDSTSDWEHVLYRNHHAGWIYYR